MKPNKFLKDRCGIYGIRNILNNKIYVGKTKCMYRRCHQYVYDYKQRKLGHLNQYLINAIDKQGIENFEFFPLEFCNIDEAVEKELHWIELLDSTDNFKGYNLRKDSSTSMIVHPNTSKKISERLKQEWKDGKRKHHSQKLKENWENNPERRKRQSLFLREFRTKYQYEIHLPGGKVVKLYRELKNMGYERAASQISGNFSRSGSNQTIINGVKIVRVPFNETTS